MSLATTKYEGAPPRTAMTDAEAERLRSQVGDDAVKLPDDHRASEVCGVAVRLVPEPVPYDGRGFNPRKPGEGPMRYQHVAADSDAEIARRLSALVDSGGWDFWNPAFIGSALPQCPNGGDAPSSTMAVNSGSLP